MRCRPPRPPTQTLAPRRHRLLARPNAPIRGRTAPRVATRPPCVQHRHPLLLHQCMMQSLMHGLNTTAPVLCLAAHRRRTCAHAPHPSAHAARLRPRALSFRPACIGLSASNPRKVPEVLGCQITTPRPLAARVRVTTHHSSAHAPIMITPCPTHLPTTHSSAHAPFIRPRPTDGEHAAAPFIPRRHFRGVRCPSLFDNARSKQGSCGVQPPGIHTGVHAGIHTGVHGI